MKKALCIAAAAALVGVVYAGAGDRNATGPSLDTIKKLAGEWVRVDEDGSPTDEVISSYRVTAAGSAVLEILFPGTDHEMLTVYHQDGDDLVLTHFCVMGNQPRMKAVRDAAPDTLVFRCDGRGTNMKSEDDKHMHRGTFTFVSADRYRSEWLMRENGEDVYTASFDVTRRKKDAG